MNRNLKGKELNLDLLGSLERQENTPKKLPSLPSGFGNDTSVWTGFFPSSVF